MEESDLRKVEIQKCKFCRPIYLKDMEYIVFSTKYCRVVLCSNDRFSVFPLKHISIDRIYFEKDILMDIYLCQMMLIKALNFIINNFDNLLYKWEIKEGENKHINYYLSISDIYHVGDWRKIDIRHLIQKYLIDNDYLIAENFKYSNPMKLLGEGLIKMKIWGKDEIP